MNGQATSAQENTSPVALDLTLVIDIGKSNAKLLLLDDAGQVLERHSRANASVSSPLGYPALDVQGLQQWMQSTLRASAYAKRCGHLIASTHGAALVALAEDALAWEPVDYEYEGVAIDGAAHTAFEAANNFRDTLSPELPAGLNAARQLHWFQNTHPEALRKTQTLLPYAQYWAWLLCGVASSEVSSLGCHTHLWNPASASYSSLAVSRGWAALFAPLRSAWEVLGTVGGVDASGTACAVGAARAATWGLSPDCQVHVGVHDSNACLARYLAASATEAGQGAAPAGPEQLTIVSSGTWTVLMAPGASADALVADRDMLGNVDVTGRITPTARFMGGREFSAIAEGAEPKAASIEILRKLVTTQTFAMPSFAQQGGPFAGRVGYLEREGVRLEGAGSQYLNAGERATLAACYCAQMTAWLIHYLWKERGELTHKIVVEGPLAGNRVYMFVLNSIVPASSCYASTDELEGTARGAWCLTRWGIDTLQSNLDREQEASSNWLYPYHRQWLMKSI